MSEKVMFPKVIGQTKAKKKLSFYIENYNNSYVLPHLLFIAPKGCGKTLMAEETAKLLKLKGSDKHKPSYTVNCAGIKNLKGFAQQFLALQADNTHFTLIFDEASELPKDVTMGLLTMLNPNDDNRNRFTFGDYVLDVDFKRHTFMFATTEADKLFHALQDRCTRIDLEDYNYDELAAIIALSFKRVKFQDGVLPEIASTLRGNARAAKKMATDIISYIKGKMDSGIFSKDAEDVPFTRKDWEYFKKMLAINPLGLNETEVRLLRVLQENGSCTLTKIAATLMLSKTAVQKDFEMFLQKQNLMSIDGQRSITNKGIEYLRNLNKELDISIERKVLK
jgi:Holliday junction resolvasome RuvABC ATP-dependent DNA helicase subunit